jgi:3-hydroxyisobutyrate dehydrogenase-like beta-hydroxyacid dehydrogenase
LRQKTQHYRILVEGRPEFQGGAARSGSIELYLPKLLQSDLSPDFKAARLKKDLTYAMGES